MVDRSSKFYRIGRATGRLLLIAAGYIVDKRWDKRPIDQFLPKNN